ncbi:4-alpha-glucanotransferase [Halpernia humi]|uniref:4-alpha-glucanotransferase n=1 Tax=Halpernia humi TaxID=493375 RepID=A0A1H5W124_9FLAO|nr:4-alpha-glucanotransferase [Halpernia humi]SEF92936.1 4-alpha-glucanotransferase [Halpernia humi]
MKLYLNINFATKYGEKLALKVTDEKGDDREYALNYDVNNNWTLELDWYSKSITYSYILKNENDTVLDKEYVAHNLNFPNNFKDFKIFDVWNLKNFPENYLTTKILENNLHPFKPQKVNILKKHSHLFRLEAPLFKKNWSIILMGNDAGLGNWKAENALKMSQTDFGVWEIAAKISSKYPIQYKYAIIDDNSGEIIWMESGNNRYCDGNLESDLLQIQADHYFRFGINELYHAAGVAVPVFALRSENGFGVGEFLDLKILGDWAKAAKLSTVQILPINDTTANFTWTDSYPYAAISVYALHPQYLSIEHLDFKLDKKSAEKYQLEKIELNNCELIDYERVISSKWTYLKGIFKEHKTEILKDKNFKLFLKENESWLFPYAAFCLLRDRYKTPNFNNWKTHKKYIAGKINALFAEKHKDFSTVMLHCWVQYQLHLQLTEARDYLHQSKISIKGDLPIGIYRYSVEAWAEPELFGMDFQAGAPPDNFSDLGQNWEFPTYNWEVMKQDGFAWWKKRFKALEQYFDAMRIDHILGFFRIWRMPMSATQGILGYFYPAVPVRIEEFQARNIPFNFDRYCKPFINEEILWNYFGEKKQEVAEHFMNNHFNGNYTFKEEFDTQRKLKNYFVEHPQDWKEEKLLRLCANVLFLQEDKGGGDYVYHPRFNINKTDSYKFLGDFEKKQIYDLYVDYFFKRQDGLWYASAMEKLPPILNATNMLICGEDLGLVPDSVPQVMDRLGLTALKVQRMPSDNIPFYNPEYAGYLNVVTASSHDSSTLRQWWHEDRELTQKYFNKQLHQYGTAPWDLTPDLAEMIMKQHLYNNAMLAIFPIQEFFATDARLTNPNMENERINQPDVFPHYWRYRMHLNLESLVIEKDFNEKIASWIVDSGRE